jgi:hypothetical protein
MDIVLGYFSDKKKEIRKSREITGFKDLSKANHVDILPLKEVSNSQLKDLWNLLMK